MLTDFLVFSVQNFRYFWYFSLCIISFRIQKILFRFKVKQAKITFFSFFGFAHFRFRFASFCFVSLPSEMRGHPSTNSPSTIYSYGNFYDGKICMIVDIRAYSFVFFSRNTKLAETGHGFPEFRSLCKTNKI